MQIDLNAFLADLKQLCAMDSGQGNGAGVQAVADFFAARYQALGLHTRLYREPGAPDSPVLLVQNSTDEQIDVLLIAHTDTVFAVGEGERRPFFADGQGMGHGPGCADCKAGCLAIYYLLRAMLEQGTCRFRFCVAMNSDEERFSARSRACFEELARRTKYCLVFEPGRANGEFVGCRKGSFNAILRCRGVSAHAGVDPEKGASAILELARWVNELDKLNDYAAGTSLVVGRFTGGADNGSVPDWAECTLNFRFLKPEAQQGLEQLLQRMKEEPFDARTTMEIELKPTGKPVMLPHAASQALFDQLRRAGERTGQKVELLTTGGGSDGNWVSALGVATLDGCGPCGGALHTENEYLILDSVQQRLDIMEQLLTMLF